LTREIQPANAHSFNVLPNSLRCWNNQIEESTL
jgi:hypothetical protein